MAYLNRAQICGHLGRDPEIRKTDKGKVANFSVATSKKWTAKDGSKQEKTEWHSVVSFNDNAVSFLERFCKKGDLVLVEGEIQYRKYTDKSGFEKSVAEIIIGGTGFVQNLSPKQNGQSNEDELDRTLKRQETKISKEQMDRLNEMVSKIPDTVNPKIYETDEIPF